MKYLTYLRRIILTLAIVIPFIVLFFTYYYRVTTPDPMQVMIPVGSFAELNTDVSAFADGLVEHKAPVEVRPDEFRKPSMFQ